MRKISFETILSASAILIAISSICISVWEGNIMRDHYRLSVRPNLEMTFDVGDFTPKITLTNKGLGPAKITNRIFYIDGKVLDEVENSFYEQILTELNFPLTTPIIIEGSGKGSTILPGEKKVIYGIQFKDEREYFDKRFILGRLSVKIEYNSLYDEEFTLFYENFR